MITATDPRVVRLAAAWGMDPPTVLREALDVQGSAALRGMEYEIGDLLEAAIVVQDIIDSLDDIE